MAGNSSTLPPRACRRKRPYSELLSPPAITVCKPAPAKRKPYSFTLSDLTYILSSLGKNNASACFRGPPDPTIYPDYEDVVPSHMDLTMVQSALESGLYGRNQVKFKEDVELIWENAMQYYPPTSAIYALAIACSKDFHRLWHEMETARSPLKAMEARVNDLEAQLKNVHKRLALLSKRQVRFLTPKQMQFLQTAFEALSPTNRLGLVTLLPRHVSVLDSEIEIHIDQMTKEDFNVVRRYVESCREIAPVPPQRKVRSEFEKQVKRGEAEIMQARAAADSSDSSDSSEDSEAGEDNGQT